MEFLNIDYKISIFFMIKKIKIFKKFGKKLKIVKSGRVDLKRG